MNVKHAIVGAIVLGGATGTLVAVWQTLSRAPATMSAGRLSVASPVLAAATGDLGLGIPWLPSTVARYEDVFVEAARKHRVDPNMLAIVTLVESGGWSGALSPTGARGLMQVMPATGQAICDERGLAGHHTDKLAVPSYNVDFGAWYFARMLQRFETDDADETVRLAASAYNGGPTRLAKHLAGDGDLSDQTKRYRHWVGDMWLERYHARSATYEEWLAAGGARLVARALAEMATNP